MHEFTSDEKTPNMFTPATTVLLTRRLHTREEQLNVGVHTKERRLLLGMRSSMSSQVARCGETSPAINTLVRLLSSVGPLMRGQGELV